jgi:AbrB family looped-hinge helix DNA binding protein
MTLKSTLSPKFQISIPKALREQLAWRAGQKFVFIPKGKGVLITPAPDRDDLVGLAKDAAPRGYRNRSDRV